MCSKKDGPKHPRETEKAKNKFDRKKEANSKEAS